MSYDNTPESRPRTRLIAKISILAGVLASFAFPVHAQDGASSIPDNAHVSSDGFGWNCDLGYLLDGRDCKQLEIPENAYATRKAYGTGWRCHRGFEEVSGTSCKPIPLPANAFLRSSGYDWQCSRGYRPERGACVHIALPEHAYLTDASYGLGWVCDRGFAQEAGECRAIDVPKNGYLTNARYGDAWACERGFFEIDGRCDPVPVPENAFLDSDAYGPGWRCVRGFEPVGGACIAIDLPENAHLDDSGNRWRCDRDFQISDRECVLER